MWTVPQTLGPGCTPTKTVLQRKWVSRLHCGLDISSHERANGMQMATFIHSITNTCKSSLGPTFTNILTLSWMSSYLNDGYLTCKGHAELPYCLWSTVLRLQVYRTNQTLQGRYSDVDTTSWLITEHTHPLALPYKEVPTKPNTARHRTEAEQPSGISYCPVMVSTYTYLAYESCPSLSSKRLAAKKGQSGKTNINQYYTGKSERLTEVTVPQGLLRPWKWTSTKMWALNGNVNFTNSTRKTF